ncbi:hypothetical protein [Halobacillus faecis]|uniref:Uncharacterized protein n=1 Tax=Halobacillus faecis TaxID=360184 RepID=A0A511WRC8_9BACI|nr:hypothetical protein [Halobacillus faecis]GEN53700.1 hypothetical protein HFA01_19620 [Halobacillus faecis]
MAKRTKKHDAEQKNKKGFDPKQAGTEFSQEFGSEAANEAHKQEAKKARKSKKAKQDN